ncbi:MAG TPA: tyrosine--tRNA ligase [Bacilli bacterium]|jgi:tyrosine--tRNA ligase|nr:tyrosine--tRNA ligase [Bacilli bacterium]
MNCVEDLKFRGLIKDVSDPKIFDMLNNEKVTFYIGTDPTADSLHIGHLSTFLICKRLQEYGHKPIILVGGATGLIGDPRPTSERAMITYEQVHHNFNGLKQQLEKLFPGIEVVDNYEWSKDISFIDYLRDYGKYFNINYMINKDIIRRRLDEGITYTEFSYMIMQSLDFMHLFENKNCLMQIAGQDQWGNITAGIELIRKKLQKEAYAFTMPLVTKKDGTKFGKSESGTIWLDPEKTSSYELYQFFLNSEDEMVIDYLKRFTFLTKEEIEDLERKHKEKPELREAAKTLAYEVVKFVHGVEAANNAKKTSEEIFSNGGISANMPSITIDIKDIENKNILDLLVLTDIASSKSEARRLVTQGGISLNKEKVLEPNTIIDKTLFNDNSLIIQKGKKTFLKVNLKDS